MVFLAQTWLVSVALDFLAGTQSDQSQSDQSALKSHVWQLRQWKVGVPLSVPG